MLEADRTKENGEPGTKSLHHQSSDQQLGESYYHRTILDRAANDAV